MQIINFILTLAFMATFFASVYFGNEKKIYDEVFCMGCAILFVVLILGINILQEIEKNKTK